MSRFKEMTTAERDAMDPRDVKMWAVRSTLMRIKRHDRVVKMPPARVLYAEYCQKHGMSRGTKLDAKNPPELPFDCVDRECDCCFQQFFPAMYNVSDEEASTAITSLVNDIQNDSKYLRDILSSHADLIVTRWKNKTCTRRQKFLVDNTDIYKTKWAPLHMLQAQSTPDKNWETMMKDFMKSSTSICPPAIAHWVSQSLYHSLTNGSIGLDHRLTWFLPFMDAETLAEDPLRLLALLHHRTTNEPAAWIMFDNAQIVLAEHLSIIPPEFNKHCVVMQGPDFGSLVPFNSSQAHRWEIVGYNKAQYLLTAQREMMSFLRKVVASICHEATEMLPRSVHPKWDALILANFATTGNWTTESVRPFSTPPSFDPHKVLDMVTIRCRAVRDEVELLQTDPAYAHFQLAQLASTVFIEKVPLHARSGYYVDEVFMVPLRRELYWRQLFKECKAMVKAFEVRKENSTDSDDNFDVMLYIVQDMAIEFFALMGSLLDYSLPFQRGMERNFEYVDGVDSQGKCTRKLTVVSRDWFPDDMLFWSLDCLGADMHRPFTLDPGLNFRVLDEMMANPKERSRISQQMYDHVTEMSTINEVISATRSQKLRNRAPSEALMRAAVEQGFRKDAVKKFGHLHIARIGEQLTDRMGSFYSKNPWPPSGKRDAIWLEKATLSRKSLARYWQMVRVLWVKELRDLGVKQETIDEDMELLSADLSPEYEMEKQREKMEVEQNIAAEQAAKIAKARGHRDLSENLSSMHVSSGKENKAMSPQPQRLKHKTRPDQSPVTNDTKTTIEKPGPSTEGEGLPPCRSITVKREHLALFRDMYPTSGHEGRRTFKWQHFLDAMSSVGFRITESSGSGVSFKMLSDDDSSDSDAGSIAFHRPHPDPVIFPIKLRAMGKRMSKWFGWNREIFVERE